MKVTIEVSGGELIDKITILSLKLARVSSEEARGNITRELAELREAHDRAGLAGSSQVEALTEALARANAALWDIEDAIRDCERRQDFGPSFVALARAVYHNNDQRSALKRQLSEACGSSFKEEKIYAGYQPASAIEGHPLPTGAAGAGPPRQRE